MHTTKDLHISASGKLKRLVNDFKDEVGKTPEKSRAEIFATLINDASTDWTRTDAFIISNKLLIALPQDFKRFTKKDLYKIVKVVVCLLNHVHPSWMRLVAGPMFLRRFLQTMPTIVSERKAKVVQLKEIAQFVLSLCQIDFDVLNSSHLHNLFDESLSSLDISEVSRSELPSWFRSEYKKDRACEI